MKKSLLILATVLLAASEASAQKWSLPRLVADSLIEVKMRARTILVNLSPQQLDSLETANQNMDEKMAALIKKYAKRGMPVDYTEAMAEGDVVKLLLFAYHNMGYAMTLAPAIGKQYLVVQQRQAMEDCLHPNESWVGYDIAIKRYLDYDAEGEPVPPSEPAGPITIEKMQRLKRDVLLSNPEMQKFIALCGVTVSLRKADTPEVAVEAKKLASITSDTPFFFPFIELFASMNPEFAHYVARRGASSTSTVSPKVK